MTSKGERQSKRCDGEEDRLALQAVKGMHDLLSPESRRLGAVERVGRKVLESHGYVEVRTPVLEHTLLFARSIGDVTDIVEKEMYTFPDRDGQLLTLRPEGTAGVVRAYLEHALFRTEPVTRWYYLGPMFRHERSQRGRNRQFYQLGVEVLGVSQGGIDAEMIAMLLDLLGELGLARPDLHLNTLGCARCRPAFREALLAYLGPERPALCEDCQRRLDSNPLRVLDCKVKTCQQLAASAPTSLDLTCSECRAHFDLVLDDLRRLGVQGEVDHRLVRGLDYYTRTTFEVRSRAGSLGSQNTIAGGGRYDGLVELLGGPPTPAIGFALGLDRLLLALGEDLPALGPVADLCIVFHGERARQQALILARDLRRANMAVDLDHRGGSIKSQMKRAGRLGSPLVLLLGEDELKRQVVALRDMAASSQQDVSLGEVLDQVRARLARQP